MSIPVDLAEQDLGVLLLAEDRADRGGDVLRGESCRRDLVEHRLEEMVIPPVDDRHANGSFPQAVGEVETGETTADDDDPR